MESGTRRYELYKEKTAEAIIALFNQKELIKPKLDGSEGYKYPDFDSRKTGKTQDDYMEVLRRMAAANILDEKIYDLELRCPKCKSPNISTRYLCPYCESMSVIRNILVEHVNCGYVSTQLDFRDDNTCPNCNKKYKEGGYRVVGKSFECSNCGKQISCLSIAHFCRDCESIFSLENAIQRKVFSYSVNKNAKDEIETKILFPSEIGKMLTDLQRGYALTFGSIVRGKSGIEHRFDIIFSSRKKTGAIDLLFSAEPILEIEVIKELSKVLDTGFETYLVAMPRLNETAEKLVKVSNLKVIQASKKKEALEELKKLVT